MLLGKKIPPSLRPLRSSATRVVCCESRRNDEVAFRRKGRTHLRPERTYAYRRERPPPSLSCYAVENRRYKACMFKVGDKSRSAGADRGGSWGQTLMLEAVHEQAIHTGPGNNVLWHWRQCQKSHRWRLNMCITQSSKELAEQEKSTS